MTKKFRTRVLVLMVIMTMGVGCDIISDNDESKSDESLTVINNPDDNNPNCDTSIDADCDGTPDSQDGCPYDPNKTSPGLCGCGVVDVDIDNDGRCDTNGDDICLGFDDSIDTDSDGVPNGCDLCDGFDDSIDTDNDGIPDGCDAYITGGAYFKYVWYWPLSYESSIETDCCDCGGGWCYFGPENIQVTSTYNEFVCDVNATKLDPSIGECWISIHMIDESIPIGSGLTCTTTGGVLYEDRWNPTGSDADGFCYISDSGVQPYLSLSGATADELLLDHYSDQVFTGTTEVIGLLTGVDPINGDSVNIIVDILLDTDGDGWPNACPTPPGTCIPDNCILLSNPGQVDVTAPFGVGDICHDGIYPDDANNDGAWD